MIKKTHLNDMAIRYSDDGDGYPILFLHGWGGRIESWAPVLNILSSHYRVIGIDLPGFGESSLPPFVWGANDYAAFISDFVAALGLGRISVVGHSFGGKIAIQCVLRAVNIERLVLVNSSGIRLPSTPQVTLKRHLMKTIHQASKPLGGLGDRISHKFERAFGSADYLAAKGVMRGILIRTLGEDIRSDLGQITTPTLLIWGDRDEATPIEIAHIMKTHIHNSELVAFTNVGHFSYLEALPEFCTLVSNFIKN